MPRINKTGSEEDACHHCLKIPGHVSIVLPETVTIRDKYKNIWQVKTRKVDGHWYLLDGWAKFVADSSVSIMDMLVFNYSGPGSLEVNIHGSDGNVKEVGYRKIDNPEENPNMESDESEDIERVLHGQNKKLDHNNIIKSKGKMGKEAFKYQDETDEYETDNDFTHDRGQGYWDGEGDDESEESNGFEFVCWENDKCKEMATELQISKNVKASKSKRRKKARVDYLGKELIDSGVLRRPEGIYFVTKMKPKRKNEVYIPMDIYMDENLYIPKKIRLVDPDGEIYPAILKVWKDGRLFYAGGWNKLCRTNHISPHDYCILEFGEGDMERYLFVSFVRVGK